MSLKEKLDGFSIQELIETEKMIYQKSPKTGMRQEYSHNRVELDLKATSIDAKFSVYIRQNVNHIHNFSIGLDYIGKSGRVQLIRFNGAHKTVNDAIDNHHYNFHIHREIEEYEGFNKLAHAENTTEYNDFESAVSFAMNKINVQNYSSFFPEIDQITLNWEDH